MTTLPPPKSWGQQRDWAWRGWQTRYSYLRPPQAHYSSVPLVLIHGFGASIGHWRHNLPVLAQRHPVYALDLLGFGASQKAGADYSIALWVEQLYAFWRALISRPAILIGNSIGALLALAAAGTYPEMARGLVMLSLPDPGARTAMVAPWLQSLASLAENLVASPPVLKALFYLVRRPGVVGPWAKLAYANPQAVTPELVTILSRPAYDQGAAEAFYRITKAMTRPDFGPRVAGLLPTLDLPMLLIWGREDRMIPYQLAPRFTALNPRVTLVSLDRVGHCPQDEAPEQVNPAILNWIAGQFPPCLP